MSRLFVGNIPFGKSEAALADWFDSQGYRATSVEIIQDYATGRSRGFGFVELESSAEAEAVVRALNGKMFAGRPLTIGRATPFRGYRDLNSDLDRSRRSA